MSDETQTISPEQSLGDSRAPEKNLSEISNMVDGLAETPKPAEPNEGGHQNHLVQVRLGIASSLFTALRAKHAPTADHSVRVSLACSAWAMAMELSDAQRDEIEIGALLHDIGKIGVPDHVLQKPGKLTQDEAALMDRHHMHGLEVLIACCSSREILEIIRFAPAWYDGGKEGFDRGGQELPLGSRMLAVVDAFDAMTSHQVYRRAMSRERAIAELFDCAGTQFDPELVRHFCALDALDQPHLHAGVARRWLQELAPDLADARWRLGQPVTATRTASSADSLFHERLLDNMHDGVVFVDANLQITSWNRGSERLTGITAESVSHKKWAPSLLDMWDEREVTVTDEECPVARAVFTGVQSLRRLTISGRQDERVAVDAHAVPVVGSDGTTFGATLVLHDVSSEATLEEAVQTLHVKATRDPLTNISNRSEFDRTLERFVEHHLNTMTPCSLIICDIDHFKAVNDTYGHQAGDEALKSFAAMMQRSHRTGDLVARYGGEEFVMLCADCDIQSAAARAEQIRREVADTPQAVLDGKRLTVSFGVTEIQPGDTPESMLRRADRGVYQAKEMGRNTVVQLGAGLVGEQAEEQQSWWSSWLRRSPGDLLLECDLVATVPINVATEKLRGFIADHNAEVVSVDENNVVLNFDSVLDEKRRSGDRSVPFLVELEFSEKAYQSSMGSERSAGTVLRTIIHVAIRPKRSRDRRIKGAADRARQLLFSVKSYLMAQEVDLDSDEPPEQ